MLGCGAMTRAFAARIAVRLMLFWTLPGVGSASGRGTRGSCGGTWGLDPGRRRPCRRGRGVCLKNGISLKKWVWGADILVGLRTAYRKRKRYCRIDDRQFGDVSKSHFAGKTRGLD